MSPDAYWIASPAAGAILQSELLSNIIEYRARVETIAGTAADVEFEEVTHPLVVVMTQDCDLDLDHKGRQAGTAQRLIESVLLCEADAANAMRARGELNNSRWRLVESHQNERYQILQSVPAAIADAAPVPAVTDGAGGGADQVAVVEPAPTRRRWFRWLLPFQAAPPSGPGAGPAGHEPLPAQFRGNIGLDFRRVFTVPMPELLRRIEIGEAHRHSYLSPVYRDHLSNRFYGYHMRVALEVEEQG